MPIDFRASQIQTNKIIASGSTGTATNALLLIYPISKQQTGSPNQGLIDTGLFSLSGIGSDVFMYVSGSSGQRGTGGTNAISVFGGDLHASGNLSTAGNLKQGAASTNLKNATNSTHLASYDGGFFYASTIDGGDSNVLVGTIATKITTSYTNNNTIISDFGSVIDGDAAIADTQFNVIAGGGGNIIRSGSGYSFVGGAVNVEITSGSQGVAAFAITDRTSPGTQTIIIENSYASAIVGAGNATVISSSDGNPIFGSVIVGGGFTITSSDTVAIGNADVAYPAQVLVSASVGFDATAGKTLFRSSDFSVDDKGRNASQVGSNVVLFVSGYDARVALNSTADVAVLPSTVVSGNVMFSYPVEVGANFRPSLTWQSQYGHEVARIWANDSFLPTTGVLYISTPVTGSNSSILAIDASSNSGKLIFASRRWISFDRMVTQLDATSSDVYFEVSGAIGSRGTAIRGTSLFRGDVHVSGVLAAGSGLSGSLTKLVSGQNYIIAGPNVTVNTNSLGQVEVTSSITGSGMSGKQFVAAMSTFASTTATAIGQFAWVPSDYTGLGSVRLRAIMSTNGTANLTGSLRLFNLTSGSYVDLVSAGSTWLTITSSTPTLVTSSNLLVGTTNFNNSSTCVYEVRVSGSSANNVVVGGVELVFS